MPTLQTMQVNTSDATIIQSSDPEVFLLTVSEPGIIVEATIDIPDGARGKIEWVQNGRSSRKGINSEGTEYTIIDTQGVYYLDFSMPYESADNSSSWEIGPKAYNGSSLDIPKIPLFPSTQRFIVQEDFRTFVTWRPENSKCPRITLGMAEWGWFVSAVNNGNFEQFVPKWNLENSKIFVTSSGTTSYIPILSGPMLQDLSEN